MLVVRFPKTMGWRRREPLLTELVNGLKFTWGNRGIRSMLLFFAVVNLFMSPLFLLVSPLVLSFGDLQDVGRVTFAGGLGVFIGGLLMTVWGGRADAACGASSGRRWRCRRARSWWGRTRAWP